MSGPTQPKVTDEIWDDDRVRMFLDLEPSSGENPDYHVLVKAYRGMRPDDFARFLDFFTEAGRNLDATDGQGRTLWQVIANHHHAAPFIAAREKY